MTVRDESESKNEQAISFLSHLLQVGFALSHYSPPV